MILSDSTTSRCQRPFIGGGNIQGLSVFSSNGDGRGAPLVRCTTALDDGCIIPGYVRLLDSQQLFCIILPTNNF